jgi:hypothetical protein
MENATNMVVRWAPVMSPHLLLNHNCKAVVASIFRDKSLSMPWQNLVKPININEVNQEGQLSKWQSLGIELLAWQLQKAQNYQRCKILSTSFWGKLPKHLQLKKPTFPILTLPN